MAQAPLHPGLMPPLPETPAMVDPSLVLLASGSWRTKSPAPWPPYSRRAQGHTPWGGLYVGVGRATGERDETTPCCEPPGLIRFPHTGLWLERALRSTVPRLCSNRTTARPLSESSRALAEHFSSDRFVHGLPRHLR